MLVRVQRAQPMKETAQNYGMPNGTAPKHDPLTTHHTNDAMKRDTLIRQVAEVFAANEAANEFLVTKDGQCFVTEHDAREHSKTLDASQRGVEKLSRASVERYMKEDKPVTEEVADDTIETPDPMIRHDLIRHVFVAFKVNKDATEFHVTKDGQCFTNEHDAKQHERMLGQHHKGIEVMGREAVEKHVKEYSGPGKISRAIAKAAHLPPAGDGSKERVAEGTGERMVAVQGNTLDTTDKAGAATGGDASDPNNAAPAGSAPATSTGTQLEGAGGESQDAHTGQDGNAVMAAADANDTASAQSNADAAKAASATAAPVKTATKKAAKKAAKKSSKKK
ncbi:MAG: hypothetical protein ABI432_08605 [Flavobacteriales bacterium]